MSNSRLQPTRLSLMGILLICMLALPAIAQETPTITLARVKGVVEVLHADDTAGEWTVAATGAMISAGWRLRTGAESKAQLVFPRDNVVILKANSVLYVDKLDAGGGAKLEADAGSLLVDLANMLAPGSEFELETPTALAVVRGTKYGADDIDDYDVTFYGYSGVVDIFDSEGESGVHLLPGFTVGVEEGMPPSEPAPSGDDAGDFLADAEDTEAFEAAEAELAPVIAGLNAILARLQTLDTEFADLEGEWARYESRDQVGQMVLLYAQAILPLEEQVDEAAADFAAAMEVVDPTTINGAADEIQALLDELYARLAELMADAAPLIDDHQDLLDALAGLIPAGDPALGLRWGMLDTDGDGLSDVDEINLGTDPVTSNTDGFFDLLAPDDGDDYEYPTDELITFEYDPMDSDLVLGYDLLIAGDGQQWLRRNIDASEDVQLELLVGVGEMFADTLAAAGEVTLDWQVLANLDTTVLYSRGTSQQGTGGLSVGSETRQFTITQADIPPANLYLVPGAVGTIRPDDVFTVRGVIEDASGVASWQLTVLYDPSVMEFTTGRKLGLFGGATLFFSDSLGGVLIISGVIPTGSGAGITGSGDFFELEFLATEEGLGTVEISDAVLKNMADVELPVDIGDEVDVEIEATLGTSDVPWDNDPYQYDNNEQER